MAGVWWVSLSTLQRNRHPAFQANKEQIKSRWSKRFGDRQNELVLIGQNMDRDGILAELEECLCTEKEILSMEKKTFEFTDEWPS